MKLLPTSLDQTKGFFTKKTAQPHSALLFANQKNNRINNAAPEAFANKKAAKENTANETREMPRSLEKNAPSYKLDSKGRKVFTAESKDKTNGFLQAGGSKKTDPKEQTKKPLNYRYKDISSQIKRAKTSVTAGQVVIKAKRQVMELKRKLAGGKEDKEEVMMALEHAKAVERVAKKKKNHLELEEMVEHTQESDANKEYLQGEENLERQNGSGGISQYDMTDIAEDTADEAISKISEMEYNEFDELYDEGAFEEDSVSIDDMMDSIGDEEIEMLEELSEQLAAAEVVDPHMSEEELSELKIKHRNREAKELLKADMDYLKRLAEYLNKDKGSPVTASASLAFASGSYNMSDTLQQAAYPPLFVDTLVVGDFVGNE